MATDAGSPRIEIQANDPEDFEQLFAELDRVPGISVDAVSAPTDPGDQGADLALLTVALSSGAITAFLQIIKVLAEARGPEFVLRIRRGRNRLKITADNLEDVDPELRRILGEP